MVFLLFGPPGCGKGTQAALIARNFKIPAISTGDMFRDETQAGTPLGKLASKIMAEGGLVGDDIVNQMVSNRISQPDCRKGFLLDGYPRSVPQAGYLGDLLKEKDFPTPKVIHLDVPSDVLVKRLTARRQCPTCRRIYNLLHQPPKQEGFCDDDGTALITRKDDTEAVIRDRLTAYEDLTGPVIGYYDSSSYHKIDGNRSPDEIYRNIEEIINAVLGGGQAPSSAS